MLKVAQELGLSETAFVQATRQPNEWTIRYFSPRMEIPLCGHATLAAARVVIDNSGVDEVVFITAEEIRLPVRSTDAGLTMEFPAYQTHATEVPDAMLNALGIEYILNSVFNQETKILLIEIPDCYTLQDLKPDFPTLLGSHNAINGVLVTAASNDKQFDFHSRYFWPWSGTNEDPVTGGTHTFLAPYWSSRLNKNKLRSFQSSARTGSMEVEVLDNHILISGHATPVLNGTLLVDDAQYRTYR